MPAVDPTLRLSAIRALLGAISPKIRLVKVSSTASLITLTAVADSELGEDEREALSIAAAEIVADFPAHTIDERVTVDKGPLPTEDVLQAGWIYRRYE
ncbi:MAG: hypothetical protein ABI740_06245 [Alphaproteobacteria bacterium]